ncbi:MAG: lipoate--protein ligase family protein [Deltaproteobacteria bacterium]|nr:lipoate--protein ligase family protein [Deltaproteobacteria bacterium]MBW2361180.1 lipoate--protein ligase family protein [Deltaproteobacteria bacterium]
MKAPLSVLRESVAGGPAVDTAVSRLLLDEVASGVRGECLRLWQPDAALAFSAIDRTRPGFPNAAAAARALGFEPFLRLAGGHAAVYAPSLLAFVWTQPAPNARSGIEARFADLARRVVAALVKLGVDARVGEVAGEFCPGDFSVNARGRVKLMGVGQRVVRGAAHVGGVLLVREAAAVRDVLVTVYAALDLDLDPASFGSVEGECGETQLSNVADALLQQFERDRGLAFENLGTDLLQQAHAAADRYRVGSSLPQN